MRQNSKQQFGLWTLVALVVGNAVGAGIYTTSGFSLADLGSREWVMLAWCVAGLIALMGALSYGMLAQGLTESGGEYVYLSRSIHPLAGFIAGWVSLLAGFPGAIAFAATAFETYLRSAIDLSAIGQDVFAVGIIVFAGAIHIVRVEAGARTHEWIVALMLLILTAIIAWAAFAFIKNVDLPVQAQIDAPFSWLAFANSLVWISLSYSGFNAAAYVAGEVKDAKHTVMRGMIIGTLITMLLCVLINAIMLYGSALVADLQGLLSYLGLTLSLCLALAVSSLFVRHWRLGDVPNSRWYPIAPLLFVSCTVLFAVLSAISQPAKLVAVLPTVLCAAIAYLFSIHRRPLNQKEKLNHD